MSSEIPKSITTLVSIDESDKREELFLTEDYQGDFGMSSAEEVDSPYRYLYFNFQPTPLFSQTNERIQAKLVMSKHVVEPSDWKELDLSITNKQDYEMAKINAKTGQDLKVEIRYLKSPNNESAHISLSDKGSRSHYRIVQYDDDVTLESQNRDLDPAEVERVVRTFHEIMDVAAWIKEKGFAEGETRQ